MESSPSWDLNTLQNVLNQGSEHMRELQTQFDKPCISAEECKLLAAKVKSAISSAISMAKLLEKPAGFDSPTSASDSPRSEGSGKASKELERREMNKKRKSQPRWSSQVRAHSGFSMEGSVDDGYSWRKYGQKDILGAKFPRSYYRCTFRHTHGCFAAKQVQRSCDDPSLLDITYRGAHTCNHGLQRNHKEQSPDPDLSLNPQSHPQPLLEYYRTGLTVKTEDLGLENRLFGSSSFSFPSSLPASWMNSDSNVFPSTSKPHDYYSPTFVSATTSIESNHVSASPCSMNGYGGELNLHGVDAEIAKMLSAATSTTSSPTVEMNFLMEQIEFETDFPFGIS